jgi:hypothetical protein
MIRLELDKDCLNAALHALRAADLALSASHNLTATDRADLPRADWPVFVLDHRAELAGLAAVWRLLAEATAGNPAASAGVAALNPGVVEPPLGG